MMDEATRYLVPWLRDRAREENSERWFFMRYWDLNGHHVRLRVQCSSDGVDRLYGRGPELLDLLRSLPAPRYEQRLIPGALQLGLPDTQQVKPCVYAPELRKYGRRAGVRLAEGLFTTASEWYQRVDPASLDPAGERAALVCEYMGVLVRTAVAESQQRDFWLAHRRRWEWQLRVALPQRDDVKLVASHLATKIKKLGEVNDSHRELLREHAAVVASTLDHAEAQGNPVDRTELLLDYMHMDINRWGFVPVEEVLLGIVAAARWVQEHAAA